MVVVFTACQFQVHIPTVPASGMSTVHDCLPSEDTERLRKLIAEGADLEAALCWAVSNERIAMAQLLLESGASPNTPRTKWNGKADDSSPLIIAVSAGWFAKSTAMLMTVLAHGPDVNYRRSMRSGEADDSSALDIACEDMQWATAKILLLTAGAVVSPSSYRHGAQHTFSALMHATHSRQTDLVELMLNKGADPRFTTTRLHGLPTRFTVLHWACQGRAPPEMLRLLVEAGADVNAVAEGPPWRTALHIVARAGRAHEAALTTLVAAGADPFDVNRAGLTTLEAMGRVSVLLDSRPSRFV